ncbi:TlpA family protein disulfide reductase [Nocardioides carbamazepini]|uniref:TlpA family protein disulfide reductase n=1 Tax=Nocardioides carbamazepini TaxID=2854259 RepID=UPI00214A0653|nr:TlpA disulfide reductase family protein [Nocardioides carbamazepini]MCR1783521.1 TlpA family protein disulfide reductase [Nocardioides carbamazepini]
MRLPAAAVALVVAGVLLTGCDSVAPAFACKVDAATPDLIEDREAAGIADCDPTTWSVADGAAAQLPDLELDCLGGATGAALSQVHGPAILNFWASNCGPCRKEMPALQAFYEAHGDRITVLGVNWLDTYPGAAIDLARQSGVTYPSLADACGDLQETDADLGIGLPFFLFVAADGTVSRPHTGGVTSPDEIVDMVATYLDLDLTAQAAS